MESWILDVLIVNKCCSYIKLVPHIFQLEVQGNFVICFIMWVNIECEEARYVLREMILTQLQSAQFYELKLLNSQKCVLKISFLRSAQ